MPDSPNSLFRSDWTLNGDKWQVRNSSLPSKQSETEGITLNPAFEFTKSPVKLPTSPSQSASSPRSSNLAVNFAGHNTVPAQLDFLPRRLSSSSNILDNHDTSGPREIPNRMRRGSSELTSLFSSSPPFASTIMASASSPSAIPQPTHRLRHSWLGLTDTAAVSSASPNSQTMGTHKPILNLRHSQPARSPQLLPVHAPHHFPPPGASPMSPSILALRDSDKSPSELTLPTGAFELDTERERWPEPQEVQAAVWHANSAAAELSPLLKARPASAFSPSVSPPLLPSAMMSPPSHTFNPNHGIISPLSFSIDLPEHEGEGGLLPQKNKQSPLALEADQNPLIEEFMRKRQRRSSSRESNGSAGSDKHSRGSSSERSPDGESVDKPHVKHPGLALPERSGWSHSDEEDEADDSSLKSPDSSPVEAKTVSPISPVNSDHELPSSPTGLRNLQSSGVHPSALLLEARGDTIANLDQDSLSVLERIFLLSKSEYKEHRMAATRSLPVWLESVDICEAYEYILPLLNGLASDDDEVKICLAQGLDCIMFHFFTKCPLLNSGDTADVAFIDELAQAMDVDSSQPTSTDSSRRSSFRRPVRLPRIPVGAFTPILGLLLMEQNIEVSSWARAAVVRFLCRLNERAIPDSFQDDGLGDDLPILPLAAAEHPTHEHEVYELTREARLRLEEQIIVDVVLGLARLEADEDDKSLDTPMSESSRHGSLSRQSGRKSADTASDSSDDDEEWATVAPSASKTPEAEMSSPDWGMSLRSYSNVVPAQQSTPGPQRRRSSISSPIDHETEAVQGKVASMELVAAIVGAKCVMIDQIRQNFVPELARMVHDKAAKVRNVAASALGPVAKSLPQDFVIGDLLPLYDEFCHDEQAMVRRWSCLVLPDVCTQLPVPIRYQRVVDAVTQFSQDINRDVRSALTEICGPVIHSFKDNVVPRELLNWYLGKPIDAGISSPPVSPSVIEPLQSMLAALQPVDARESLSTPDAKPDLYHLSLSTDTERALLSAYNFPAVALTLGPTMWHMLADFHAQLAKNKQAGVRRCVAGSLHAVAEIIGVEHTKLHLLPIAHSLLMDTSEVRENVLANVAQFAKHLGRPDQLNLLTHVHDALYSAERPTSWRVRESISEQLVEHVSTFVNITDHTLSHDFVNLVHGLMKDEVTAVRSAAVKIIPAILRYDSSVPMETLTLDFLHARFAKDASYRHRSTYIACTRLLLEQDSSSHMPDAMLANLVNLSYDPILNVRAELAKLCHYIFSASAGHDRTVRHDLIDMYHRLAADKDSFVRDNVGQHDLDSTSEGSLYRLATQSSEISSTPPFDPSPPQLNGFFGSDRSDDEDMDASHLSSSTIQDIRALVSRDVDDVLRKSQENTKGWQSDQMLFDDFVNL